MKVTHYTDIRSQMKPGDVIAIAGKDNFFDVIKWATRSNTSHITLKSFLKVK